ncbi:MAG: hypothetical protein ACTSUE_04220 [Promethearchaeota archaeon]
MRGKRLNSLAVLVAVGMICSIGVACFYTSIHGLGMANGNQDGISPITTSQIEDPAVPTWDDILYSTVTVFQQEVPTAEYTTDAGIVISDIHTVYYPENTTNATNLDYTMVIHYIESFNLSCPDVGLTDGENYSVRYNASVLGWHSQGGPNFNRLLIHNENVSSEYLPSNASLLNAFLSIEDSTLTIDLANTVGAIEETAIYDNASFIFEFNVTFKVNFTQWNMDVNDGNPFVLEGRNSSRMVNFTQTTTLDSLKGIDLKLNLIPVDFDLLKNVTIYIDDVPVSKTEVLINGSKAWRMGDLINTDGGVLKIEFSINFTVGFVDTYSENWARDVITNGANVRARSFYLDVLNGSETYLVEKVEYNATNMDYRYVISHRNDAYSEPEASVSVSNNTYRIYDDELEKYVYYPNGTSLTVGRLQKEAGKVRFAVIYSADFDFSLRILDEVRNPLRGAEVFLYYSNQSIRYGTDMKISNPINYPSKITDIFGKLDYYNMPQGKYFVEVIMNGKSVGLRNFTIGDNLVPVFEVVTDIPYQPTILILWLALFSVISLVGLAKLKKKR